MIKTTCKDCAAFAAMSNECRRHAPVMLPVPQQNAVGSVTGYAAIGLYPATSGEKWCAEFVAEDPLGVLQ